MAAPEQRRGKAKYASVWTFARAFYTARGAIEFRRALDTAQRSVPILDSSMRHFRFAWIVRAVTLILLCGTAVDLADIQLCAVDRPANAVQGGSDEPVAAIVNAAVHPQPLPLHGNPASQDDCFCCSHTVTPADQLQVTPIVGVVGLPNLFAPTTLSGLPTSLYHPPLVA